ncbi:MAG: DUF3604 domain-containing protein [Holophagales bacterium]|nr:DUF3604 domain-containing protein [Holophagales bacterium]MYG31688.1 DUF3604 domain-containing protein [Holophagales bacterium]MYI79530.1 DUF3604 domain-containing protein [Holophagales bacterium]
MQHTNGFRFQLRTGPLDFLAVTDHGAFLADTPAIDDPDNPFFAAIGPGGDPSTAPRPSDTGDGRSAWQEIVDAAGRHNDPGSFTTFIGYEYTAFSDDRGNLHRNVIFRGDTAPPRPFTANDSHNPEDLWRWLDARRAEGFEALAIPHNSNGSNGQMFRLERFDGGALDAAYAEQRNRNEPLVEVTQIKGTSDTHPLLSPNDEWADFEIYAFRVGTTLPSQAPGSYVRQAYLNGLVLEETRGFNPFRFGLIGSTDSHNAGGTTAESNFHGKIGTGDGTPERRGSVPLDPAATPDRRYARNNNRYYSASGLTGVWAEQNTRDAIYDSLRRKETFATTGSRIRVRFFAGYDYPDDLASDQEMVEKAYDGGVPMGGDLLASAGRSPRFLVWAVRDKDGAPLQRLQVVKGWVEDGEARERVADIACSDGFPSGSPPRCPDNGATVDLSDCSFPQHAGAAELSALWLDPGFDPAQRAFYYVRVLENPTCRWSTWDALRAGVEPRPDLPATLQERAWSSPIWYVPSLDSANYRQ